MYKYSPFRTVLHFAWILYIKNMDMRNFKYVVLLGTSIFFTLTLAAQQRYTESDVNLEKVFIEANRERLLENYDNAEALYKEVLKRDRNNDAAAYELARIYDLKTEEDKAIKFIKNAIELAPDNLWYKKFLADVYQKIGRYKEAAEVYETLVEKESFQDEYYFKWAYFLVRANEIDKAVKVYDELEKKVGINEDIARRKHSLYLGSGNSKKAAKELERLVEAFPNITSYRHLLADFYEQIGDKDQAKAVYREILTIDPGDAKASLALAGNSKNRDELQYLESLKPIFSQEDVDLDLKISRLFPFISKVANTQDKELATAALELTQILENVHSEDAKVFSASGDLLYHSNQLEPAYEKYKHTIELDESVFSVWENLLYIQLELKNYKGLQKDSEAAMDIFPNKAVVYYLNGVALNELGEQEDAEDMLEQALLMSGSDGRLQFNIQSRMGLVLNAQQRYQEADEAFDLAMQLNGESPELLNNYSFVLAERGEQLAKAKEMIEKANKLLPGVPGYEDTYGWVLYKMRNFEEAQKWLGQAVKNSKENDPQILEHYGDVLYQLGDVDQAIQYWTKSQNKGNKSALIEKKIADRKLYE